MATGVHASVYGNDDFVPIETPLAKNCTLAIVVPALGELALAVRFTVLPTGNDDPLDGEVIEMVGAPPAVTRKVTGADVVLVPPLSVATAVTANDPSDAGVHVKVYGNELFVPTKRPLANKSTEAIEPLLEAAVTVTVCWTFTGSVVLFAGLETATVGAEGATTVTATGDEVVRLPDVSVATAVNVYVPAAVGVKLTLKGKPAAAPMLTPFAKNSTPVSKPLPSAVEAETVIGLPIA